VATGTNGYWQFVTTAEIDAAYDVGSRKAPHDQTGAPRIGHPNPEPTREFVALAFRVDDFAKQARLEFLNAASSITFPVIETGVVSHFASKRMSSFAAPWRRRRRRPPYPKGFAA
jgi:hypothetical protein